MLASFILQFTTSMLGFKVQLVLPTVKTVEKHNNHATSKIWYSTSRLLQIEHKLENDNDVIYC